jgi:hypothetical protein
MTRPDNVSIGRALDGAGLVLRTDLGAEIAQRAGLSAKHMERVRHAERLMHVASLDAPIGDDDDRRMLGDTIAGADPSAEDLADLAERRRRMLGRPRRRALSSVDGLVRVDVRAPGPAVCSLIIGALNPGLRLLARLDCLPRRMLDPV